MSTFTRPSSHVAIPSRRRARAASLALTCLALALASCSSEAQQGDAASSGSFWARFYTADDLRVTATPTVELADGTMFSGPWDPTVSVSAGPGESSEIKVELSSVDLFPGGWHPTVRLFLRGVTAPTKADLTIVPPLTLVSEMEVAKVGLSYEDDEDHTAVGAQSKEGFGSAPEIEVRTLSPAGSNVGKETPIAVDVVFAPAALAMSSSSSGSGFVARAFSGRIALSTAGGVLGGGSGGHGTGGGSGAGGAGGGGSGEPPIVWGKSLYLQSDKRLKFESGLVSRDDATKTYTVALRMFIDPDGTCPGCGYWLYASNGVSHTEYHRHYPADCSGEERSVLTDDQGQMVLVTFPLTGSEVWDEEYELPRGYEGGDFLSPMYWCVDDDSLATTRCQDLDQAKASSTTITCGVP